MVNTKIRQILPKLISKHFSPQFLQHHTEAVIGYGSGVFPQTAKQFNNTVDLMVIVKNASMAHQQLFNSQESRDDYSGLSSIFGSGYINFLHRYIFPAHFNHPIVEGTKIKYGIIDKQTFEKDLLSWNLMSFAGRLHKPVWFDVMGNASPLITPIINTNHRMALAVTLLRLITKINNKQTPLQNLFQEITHLSYLGDIRHSFSIQNKNKTSNIVKHNYALFKQIYCPLLERLAGNLSGGKKAIQLHSDSIYINYTPQIIMKLTHPQSLPASINDYLSRIYQEDNKSLGEHILMGGAGLLTTQITQCLAKINKRSSTWMAVQNFLGASPIDNFNYILKKIKKRQNK